MATSANRRDDILSCTQSLIIAGGYNGFSYADISEVVGIRKATIHHHFSTKASLVRELVLQYRQRVDAGLAQLEKQIPEPLEQLRAYTGYWKSCLADGTMPFCVCALLASEIPVLPEEVATEVRGHFQRLGSWTTSILQRGVHDGTIRLEKPPAVEAEILVASVHGALLSARAHGDPNMFALIIDPVLARISVK